MHLHGGGPSTGGPDAPSGWLRAQAGQGPLWLSAVFVFGAAALLAAPLSPISVVLFGAWAVAVGLVLVLAFWPALGWSNLRSFGFAAALVLAAGLSGASLAQLQTLRAAATPRLVQTTEPLEVSGWVLSRDRSGERIRLTLRVHSLGEMATPPRRVRVSSPDGPAPAPGRFVRCRVVLHPPEAPLVPGGYDLQRRAFFDGLGGTGFSLGRCRISHPAPAASLLEQPGLWLAGARWDLASVIATHGPTQGGAFAAALIAGETSFLSPQSTDALRDAGLAHIISVSGLHMALIGGTVFGLVHALLALIGPLALRVPIRKIAAIAAILTLSLYLVISGNSVPAQRAYVMAMVAFGAILLDRPAISLRGVAVSAVLVTALSPAAVLEPGYQMSFAATLALVSGFEVWQRHRAAQAVLAAPGPLIGTMEAVRAALLASVVTSLIAGAATDPFALYHFQRHALYGLPANIAAGPIVTFVVAPAAILAAVLLPFGLAEWPLEVMAQALALVVEIGHAFGARPEAVQGIAQIPALALALFSVGLVGSAIARGGLRWMGLGLIALSALLAVAAPRPVLIATADLSTLLWRDGQGVWHAVQSRPRPVQLQRVAAVVGLPPASLMHTAVEPTCAAPVCQWTLSGGLQVSLVTAEAGFAAACATPGLMLSPLPVPPNLHGGGCGATLLADGQALSAGGGLRVTKAWLPLPAQHRYTLTWVRPHGAQRPWHLATTAPDQL